MKPRLVILLGLIIILVASFVHYLGLSDTYTAVIAVDQLSDNIVKSTTAIKAVRGNVIDNACRGAIIIGTIMTGFGIGHLLWSRKKEESRS